MSGLGLQLSFISANTASASSVLPLRLHKLITCFEIVMFIAAAVMAFAYIFV
jgi:hypothetical protein